MSWIARSAADLRPAVAAVSYCCGLLAALGASGCTRSEDAATPLPTRQTTIDPVKAKLDAAQQEAERRRANAERETNEPQR